MADPTHYVIPAPLLAATLDYLSKRPFIEVADAIVALQRLEPAPESGVTLGPPPDLLAAAKNVVLDEGPSPDGVH